MQSSEFADEAYFWFKQLACRLECKGLRALDERAHIACSRIAYIDKYICMPGRNLRIANSHTAQAKLIEELACWYAN